MPYPTQTMFDNQMRFIREFKDGKTSGARAQRVLKNQANQNVSFQETPILRRTRFYPSHLRDPLLSTTGVGNLPPHTRNLSGIAPNKDQAKDFRQLSRARIIHGPVDFYDEGFSRFVTIDVVSLCGINLMGSSEADEAEFLIQKSGKLVLDENKFREEYRSIADHIIRTAAFNRSSLVTPAFGSGVYLNRLDQPDVSPGERKKAQQIIFECFAKASIDHRTTVYWDAHTPAGKAQYDAMKRAVSTTMDCSKMHIETGDIVKLTQDKQARKEKVTLLNPGSDRTIGGGYTASPLTHKNLPLEEQLSQQSDLVLLHSHAFNPYIGPKLTQSLPPNQQTSHLGLFSGGGGGGGGAAASAGPKMQASSIMKGDYQHLVAVLDAFKRQYGHKLHKITVRGSERIKGLMLKNKGPLSEIICDQPYVIKSFKAWQQAQQTQSSRGFGHGGGGAAAGQQIQPTPILDGERKHLQGILNAFKNAHRHTLETGQSKGGFTIIKGLSIQKNGSTDQIICDKQDVMSAWQAWYQDPNAQSTQQSQFGHGGHGGGGGGGGAADDEQIELIILAQGNRKFLEDALSLFKKETNDPRLDLKTGLSIQSNGSNFEMVSNNSDVINAWFAWQENAEAQSQGSGGAADDDDASSGYESATSQVDDESDDGQSESTDKALLFAIEYQINQIISWIANQEYDEASKSIVEIKGVIDVTLSEPQKTEKKELVDTLEEVLRSYQAQNRGQSSP
jgi:hypothetical protein